MELAGLDLNDRFNSVKPSTWADARNVLINKGFKSVNNENGFDLKNILPLPVIGIINTGSERVVWLSNNNISEIGIVKDDVYTPMIRDSLFRFNRDYPIQAIFTYNYKRELIVAWTDNYNPIRILNLNNLPFRSHLTADLSLVNPEEFILSNLFPNIEIPVITPTKVSDGGGNLKSGVYYVVAAYGYEDNTMTNWLNISNPVSIIEANTYQGYDQMDGCTAGTPTNKAIQVGIYNLDINFTYLYVGVIMKVNGILSAYSLEKYTINSNIMTVTIQSVLRGTPIEIAAILTPSASYVKAGTITHMNSEAIIADLETMPDLDYQPYANKIKIEWTRADSVSLNGSIGSYKDPIVITSKRGFRAGEVYGFVAGIRLKTGGFYKGYHIPGHAPNTGDLQRLDDNAYPEAALFQDTVQTYQIFDTSTDTSGNGTRGEMSFWQNKDEVYPAHFPVDKDNNQLAHTNVRHHKFPTLSALEKYGSKFINLNDTPPPVGSVATAGSTLGYATINRVAVLTFAPITSTADGNFTAHGNSYIAKRKHNALFNLSTNIEALKQSNWTTIVMRVLITKRDAQENILSTLVDATTPWVSVDATHMSCTLNHSGQTLLEIGQRLNITVEFKYLPISIIESGVIVGAGTISCTSSASLIATPGTAYTAPLGIIISGIEIPDSIKPYVAGIEILYYERTVDNMSILDQSITVPDNWNKDTPTYERSLRFHGFDIMNSNLPVKPTHVMYELEFTKPVNPITDYLSSTVVGMAGDDFIPISNVTHLPAHNVATHPNNVTKENCFYVETAIDLLPLVPNVACLVNLCVLKRNMYYNMTSQHLVSTGMFNNVNRLDPNTEFIIYGGDTFISPYSIIVYRSPIEPPTLGDDPLTFAKRILTFPVESIANIGFRQEGLNPNEKYYPKSPILDTAIFVDGLLFETGNWYEYNNDYSSIHNLYSIIQDDRLVPFINTFPYRIARSLPQGKETSNLKWRNFIATNYYDMPSNNGRIWNVLGYGQSLFIRHKFTTFRAHFKDMLQVLNTNAYLTKGDIFDREPEELIPIEEGYMGCQSKFADITTKHGAILVDRERGKIWLVGDGIKEITQELVDKFFTANLNTTIQEYIDYPLLANLGTYIAAGTGKPLIYSDPLEILDVLKEIDNPFKNKGICVGYDDINDRLFVTKINTILTEATSIDIGKEYLPTTLVLQCDNNYLFDESALSFKIDGTLIATGVTTNLNDPVNYRFSTDNAVLLQNIADALLYNITLAGYNDRFETLVSGGTVIVRAITPNTLDVIHTITEATVDGSIIFIMSVTPTQLVDNTTSFTMSYLMNKYWVAFHDYLPNFYYNSRTNIHCGTNDNIESKLFDMNHKDVFGKYLDDTIHPAYIDFSLNLKEQFQNVIIEAVKWQTDVKDVSGFNLWDKTITDVMVYNSNQCSGLIPIKIKGYGVDNGNTVFDHYWVLAEFRDTIINSRLTFFDSNGKLISNNLSGETAINIIADNAYLVTGCDTPNDYITYNGKQYRHNGTIIKGVLGGTTFELHGTALLKNHKYWFDMSLIIGNFGLVRLLYNNVDQNEVTINACKLIATPKI